MTTTFNTYSVKPPVLSLVLQVVFALVPLVAITIVSLRIDRGLPWVFAPWLVFGVTWAWQSFAQLSAVALAKPSLKSVAIVWANGAWGASSMALVLYLVALAVVGPGKALVRGLPA